MSSGWTENHSAVCDHCKEDIYWNPLVRNEKTGRQRALNSPYYPDQGQEPDIHSCGPWGTFTQGKDIPPPAPPKVDPFPHIPKPYPPGVILGVTHLWWRNEFVRFLKCPFCSFRNIHEDTITHHIKFTKDKQHENIQLETLDKSTYIVK